MGALWAPEPGPGPGPRGEGNPAAALRWLHEEADFSLEQLQQFHRADPAS